MIMDRDILDDYAAIFAKMTDKQREVLELVANNFTSKEIAFELGISESAVNQRIETVRQRAGSPARSELARVYRRLEMEGAGAGEVSRNEAAGLSAPRPTAPASVASVPSTTPVTLAPVCVVRAEHASVAPNMLSPRDTLGPARVPRPGERLVLDRAFFAGPKMQLPVGCLQRPASTAIGFMGYEAPRSEELRAKGGVRRMEPRIVPGIFEGADAVPLRLAAIVVIAAGMLLLSLAGLAFLHVIADLA